MAGLIFIFRFVQNVYLVINESQVFCLSNYTQTYYNKYSNISIDYVFFITFMYLLAIVFILNSF